MNKKQIYILSLLLSLMLIIFCMQQIFSKDIRKVALRNNGVKGFSEYKLSEESYEVLLPRDWLIEERVENIDGKELGLKFDSSKVSGSITLLDNINEVDKVILKDAINKVYYGYSEDDINWYVIDYEICENNATSRRKCYFRKDSEGKVILINFKYKTSKPKPSMEVVFEEIVNNFR